MTITNVEKMQAALTENFPKAWFRIEDSHIVSGEGSYTAWRDDEIGEDFEVELFDYYDQYSLYEMGVYKPLADFCGKRGWYWECYDPGTFHLYRI